MRRSDIIIEGWTEIVKQRVRNDLDAIIIAEGDEGTGKSSLAVWGGLWMDKRFSLDNVIYSMEKAVNLVYSLPPGGVIVWDEACYDMSKRDAMTKTNKAIIKLAMGTRSRNLIHIVCIPHIQDLENYISDRRACYTLSVNMKGERRGFFDLKYPKRTYDKHNNIHTRWFPMFRNVRFSKLPDDVDKEYKRRKEVYSRAKMESISESDIQEDGRYKQYKELKKMGLTDTEIGERWDMTQGGVAMWKKRKGVQI